MVNYDLPVKHDPNKKYDPNKAEPDCEVYLHRVGRAGRFGRKGVFLICVFSQCCKYACDSFSSGFYELVL